MERSRPSALAGMLRMAALASVVGPVLFVVGLVVITWMELDYLRGLGWSLTDHKDSAWPSGLAQGPYGWLQVANYALLGLSICGLAFALRHHLPAKRSRGVAFTLMFLLGIAFLFVAFPEDGPPFGEPTTWSGYLHGIGFLGVNLLALASPIATAIALRGLPEWRGYPWLSLAAAGAIFLFLVLLVFVFEVATTLGIYGFFVALLAWLLAHAWRLHRLGRRRSTGNVAAAAPV